MEVIIVAVIVSVVAPLISGWVANRLRHSEKLEDWARQDRVEGLARQNLEQNQRIADYAPLVDSKLDVIHTLVDGNITAAVQSELDATRRELLLMQELDRPLTTLNQTSRKVTELEAQLADRMRRSKQADRIVESR